MAYPEVLRMELERLDALQAAIWPLTQHRRVSLDDGTEISVEPDMKAIQQVLSIMDRRSKLLGMENNNVSISMDLSTNLAEPIRVSMIGDDAEPLSAFSPESEARELLQLMARSGVLPEEEVDKMLLDSRPAEEAPEVRLEYRKGDIVKITEGPFEGYEGTIDDVDPEKGLVRVLVTIFGRQAPVEIEYWMVEKGESA